MKNDRGSLLWLWIVLGVFGGIALFTCLGVVGCTVLVGRGVRNVANEIQQQQAEAKKQEERDKKAAMAVSLTRLLEDYKENEVAADQKYRDKWLRIDGRVSKIAKSAAVEQMYIELKPDRASFLRSLSCYFNEASAGKLAALTVDQNLKIIGKCKGKGSLWDCEIVD